MTSICEYIMNEPASAPALWTSYGRHKYDKQLKCD
jgi:hypothetical protein